MVATSGQGEQRVADKKSLAPGGAMSRKGSGSPGKQVAVVPGMTKPRGLA